jgi:hypothetical protein
MMTYETVKDGVVRNSCDTAIGARRFGSAGAMQPFG